MRPIALLVAVACVAGVAVRAQEGAKATASGQTFRAATRLIQVSVVVHDGRRRPIEGLQAGDFQLFEDGKERPVSLFAVHAQNGSAATAAASGVFTNRVQSPSSGGVVAIVFDRLNTAFGEQKQARDHIIKYLDQVRPDDRVALYVLGPDGMRVLHDFTKDARSLLRTLERVRARSSQPLAASEETAPEPIGFGDAVDAEMDAFARASFENMQAHFDRSRAYTSLEGLEEVASHLAGVPGRKNLVWVSSGFPFRITESGPGGTKQSTTMSVATRRATRALNNSDIAVYPVDARGLVGAFATPPSTRVQQFTTLDSVYAKIDGVRLVADWTGGRAFFNTNDLGGAIKSAVDDSRLTYILGYYPANEAWDSKFRTIKVKVRRDGAQVRHRSGYFAVAPEASDTRSRQKAILDALDSPLEATSLPMVVTALPTSDGRVTLTIRLDPSFPTFSRQADAWVGSIDLTVAQTLSSGVHVKDAEVTVPFSLDDAKREQLSKAGLQLTRTIDLRPDAHQVRVVARDVNSGTTGSVIITSGEIGRK